MGPGDNKEIVVFENMCPSSSSAADEPRALCIIRDQSSCAGQYAAPKYVMNLPSSTTADELVREVGIKFSYEITTFGLILATKEDTPSCGILVHMHSNQTLRDMGFKCEDNERNNLVIVDINSSHPRIAVTTSIFDVDENCTEKKLYTSCVPTPPPPPPYPVSFPYKEVFHDSSTSDQTQQESYVGLVNQAMTCYLNSLLQTLFMTPEFRNALYRWEFDGTEEEGTKSIPFQLQKLFLQLQTTNRSAVGTTELTTSFGWDSSEAWQQHDVQELCRVMFDALEQKFKNTEQADLISNLYAGKLKDYVKCLECGYESAREDTFLDVPLVVRPFGSNQAYASVGEALEAFVTPEILQGSNQYFCEHCDKKCDAHKGLKFIKFPYLLTLQLKRFDFDPCTMRRIKLNDRVFFPEILTLNEFIKSDSTESKEGSNNDSSPISPDVSSDSNDDEGICVGSYGSEKSQDLHCVSAKNIKKFIAKGPYVYELFSIMVHSGSANGGHYYAYIKSFFNDEWYCFNDAQVSKITSDDLEKTYGGGSPRGFYSSAYSSSVNAYMLMYRQINKEKNAEFMTMEQLPEHTQALLQCMQDQEERERQQREIDRTMCQTKLFCHHPLFKIMIEMKLKVRKDCTLYEATQTAHKILGLEKVVPLELCRLVKYDEFLDFLECSFDDDGHTPMDEVLASVHKSELFLEIRKPNEQFVQYKPGGIIINIHIVDLEEEDVINSSKVKKIRSHLTNTVAELKCQIAKVIGIPFEQAENIRVVLDIFKDYKLLDSPNKTLRSEGFQKSDDVYIEYKDLKDAEKPIRESKFCKILECYSNRICLNIVIQNTEKVEISKNWSLEDDGIGDEEKVVSAVPGESFDFRNLKWNSTLDNDEGLGDSEMGDSVMSNSPAIHSDQSEDSSQADSERTLVGDSPRNNSPDISGNEMDIEPDALQHQESSKDGSDSASVSTSEGSNKTSPEKETEDECTTPDENQIDCSKLKCYFKAFVKEDEEANGKCLKVYLNKCMTVGELKKRLEPYVGLSSENFRVFEESMFELTNLSKSLFFIGDDKKLLIKRVLCKGEHNVKIYYFVLNALERMQLLLELVVREGTSVLQLKKKILPFIRKRCNFSLPLNRCRLRKKTWLAPGTIYFDYQVFGDIPLPDNDSELLLEELKGPETVTSLNQHFIFCRKWHTSFKFQEIIVEQIGELTTEIIFQKLSETSGIPQDCIEISQGACVFPSEIPLYHSTEKKWLSLESIAKEPESFNCSSPHNIYELFYRDSREELKDLSWEEMAEVKGVKESCVPSERSIKNTFKNVKTYFSPRKEKALKIYTVDSNCAQNSQTSQSKTSSTKTTLTQNHVSATNPS